MYNPGFSLRLIVMPLTVATLLTGCGMPSLLKSKDDEAASGRAAEPVEQAETAYLAQTDNGFALPAVALENLPASLRRQEVFFQTTMPIGSIIIHPGQNFLYFINGNNSAIRYGISAGKPGYDWAGEAIISGTQNWPTWTPPAEMIAANPALAQWQNGQPGGLTNPLGARAIFLLSNGQDYGYSIHGTPDWATIGKSTTSGSIQMIQQDVIDLTQRVTPGASVVVLNADGSFPTGLRLPSKTKKKAVKPAVKTSKKPVAKPPVEAKTEVTPKPTEQPKPTPKAPTPAPETPASVTKAPKPPATATTPPSAPKPQPVAPKPPAPTPPAATPAPPKPVPPKSTPPASSSAPVVPMIEAPRAPTKVQP